MNWFVAEATRGADGRDCLAATPLLRMATTAIAMASGLVSGCGASQDCKNVSLGPALTLGRYEQMTNTFVCGSLIEGCFDYPLSCWVYDRQTGIPVGYYGSGDFGDCPEGTGIVPEVCFPECSYSEGALPSNPPCPDHPSWLDTPCEPCTL